jgi:peptide alpha-N-acetyltransferase
MLWLLSFIALHYLFIKELDTALHWVNIAIEHTPTLIELYEIKGRIHQAGGDWKRG